MGKIMLAYHPRCLGFYPPDLFLTSRIQRRQKEIRRAMPDAFDLLTICVEAGLGFDGAMAKVFEKWDNELGSAFGRVMREIQLGNKGSKRCFAGYGRPPWVLLR